MTSQINETLLATVCEQLNSTQPVRNAFHMHGYNTYRGLYPSSKGVDGTIPYESALAKEAIRLFDLAPEVVMIVPEPFALNYELDNEVRRYTPDFLLHLRDGKRAVIEVKYLAEANLPVTQRRFQSIRHLLEAAGALFAVLTEETLRAKVLQHNLALVESQRHRHLSSATLASLFQHLRHGPTTMEELSRAVGDRRLVLAAIGQNFLAVDLRKPILASTLIRRA